MYHPIYRPRRIRGKENFRRMVAETVLTVDNLVYPLFVVPGNNVRQEISSLPGNYHLSVDKLVEEAKEAADLGIPAVLLFGVPEPADKNESGSSAYASGGLVQQACRALKKARVNVEVITDVCLCEYTDHGHCGIIKEQEIDNDSTLELLARQALSHAQAGADMVAPSDMMDGRVEAIRTVLDEKGFSRIPIMSYAVKYASAFYGPFREAAQSAPSFGDRRSHQMDPAGIRESLVEANLDVEEGADIIMVKPALSYLDIICRIKEEIQLPVAAYSVSGEFSMVKAAAAKGWIDETRTMMEMLVSIKRAGADIIITYFAKDAARSLKKR
ncbi:MAG: porphobilinogen synthase [bacterium]